MKMTAGYWFWLFLTLLLVGVIGFEGWTIYSQKQQAKEAALAEARKFTYDMRTGEVEGVQEAFLHLQKKEVEPAAELEAESDAAHSADETHADSPPVLDAESGAAHEHADKHVDKANEAKPAEAAAHTPDTHDADAPPDHQAPPKVIDKQAPKETTGASAKNIPAEPAKPAKPTGPPPPPPAPWDDNAHAFTNPKGLPVVSILITGLGMSKSTTEQALTLPLASGLGFSPYAHDIRVWTEQAREKNFEVYTEIPMEPMDYPLSDPGPNALLTDLDEAELAKRLAWVMKRSPLDVGLVSPAEEKFTGFADAMQPTLKTIGAAQQFFIRSRSGEPDDLTSFAQESGALGFAADQLVDETISADAITESLQKLETQAANRGYALGVGRPYPITLRQVKSWAKTLEKKGMLLAPPSHIAGLLYHRQQQGGAPASEAEVTTETPETPGTPHKKSPEAEAHAPAQH